MQSSKLFFSIITFVAIVLFTKGVTAATLPDFVYIGGSQLSGSTGQKITNNDPVLNKILVKKYKNSQAGIYAHPDNTGFYFVPGNQYILSGTDGCFDPKDGQCFIDEVWKTNATVEPSLDRVPKGYTMVLKNIGLVSPYIIDNNGAKKQCKFEYVLIDDDNSIAKEGFYITASNWTQSTIPAGIKLCGSSTNPANPDLRPVYCSPNPNEVGNTMVVKSSFDIPRTSFSSDFQTKNLYIVSTESIGFAGAINCKPSDPPPPPPPVLTDVQGFLWLISDPSCPITASAAQRANCKMNSTQLQNNIRIRVYLNPDSTTPIETVDYDLASRSYSAKDLELDGKTIKVCVEATSGQTNSVNPNKLGGTLKLASTKQGNTSLGVSGECTDWFSPASYGGTNNVHLGFSLTQNTVDPWYTTLNGDIYAGQGSILNPDLPASKHLATGTAIVQELTSKVFRYAENGFYVSPTTYPNQWATDFPHNLPANGNPLPASPNINRGYYVASVAQVNAWIASINPATGYNVQGTDSKLAVIKVTGSGDIVINKNIKAQNNSRVILITDPTNPTTTIDIVFQNDTTTFGGTGYTVNGAPHVELGIIAQDNINFLPKPSTPNEIGLIYKGFLVNYGNSKNIKFAWTLGNANSTTPANVVQYDPRYIIELEKLELAGVNTGLTTFDRSWEVLD